MATAIPIWAKGLLAGILAVLAVVALSSVCLSRDCLCVSRQIDTIRVPYSRSSVLAVNPVTGLLFVAVEDAMEMAVYDTANLAAGPLVRVPTEGYHGALVVDEQANRVYVAQQFAHRVRVIDGQTFDYHDIEVPELVNAMGSLAVDPERRRLFVGRLDNFDVAVFDTSTEQPLFTMAEDCCPSKNSQIALDPATGMLWIVDNHPARVTVYQGDGQRVAAIPVGDSPVHLALDPQGRRAYVANHDSHNVSVIDMGPEGPTAFTAIDDIPLHDSPYRIAVDATAHRAYVSNMDADTVSILDLSARRLVKALRLDPQPLFVAQDPVTSRVYVNMEAGRVAVLQDCPVGARGTAAERRARFTPVVTPVWHSEDLTEARHSDVRCNRMFRVRTLCLPGSNFIESSLAQATVEASGAQVVDDGAAGQFCGTTPDSLEPDLLAAGYYYSVPVLDARAVEPTLWTFHSTTGTSTTLDLPANTVVSRASLPPITPWREALWYLSRCKTGLETCCE